MLRTAKRFLILPVVVFLTAATSLPAFAASSEELEGELSDYDSRIKETSEEKDALLEQIKGQYDTVETSQDEFNSISEEYEEYKALFDINAKKNSVKLMNNGNLNAVYAKALRIEFGVQNTTPFSWEGYLDTVSSQKEEEYENASENVDKESQKLSDMLGELSEFTEAINQLKQEQAETETRYNEAKQAEEEEKKAEGERIAAQEDVMSSGAPSAFDGMSQEEAQMVVASKIYSVLKFIGWPDEMIAGALGNINVESGLDFTSVEWLSWHCDERFAWGPNKQAWDEGDYLIAYLNPGQSNTVIRSGIGLIQWSDTKDGATGNTDLRQYAAQNDTAWYNLTLQLQYLTDREKGDTYRADMIYNWNNYNNYSKGSPSECAYWWAAYIEGCTIDLGERQSYAEQWHDRLSSLTYDEGYAKQVVS